LKKIITLEHNKFNTLNDIMQVACLFFNYKLMHNDDKIKKILFSVSSELVLIESLKNFSEHEQYNFSAGTLELYARKLAVKYNLKTSQVFHPIRIAIAGKMSGPSLFHMMEILGKEEVINRIRFALNIINKSKEDYSNVKN
jgi:glutamyl/glutaminyl-tRNA synthetase